jgi:ATP-binding cassette subfamily B protein
MAGSDMEEELGRDDSSRPKVPLWTSAAWTFGLIWENHRKMLIAATGITLLRGLLPAGLALTVREFINAANAGITDSGGERDRLIFWFVLGLFAALAETLCLLLNNLISSRLKDQINTRFTVDILRKAARKPLSFFEDPRQREMIGRATAGASGRASTFVQAAQGGITQTIQAAGLVAVLFYIEPLVLLIVGPVAIPFLIYQWRLAKRRYLVSRNRSFRKRKSSYFSSLLTSPRTVAEVKLFGIAGYIVDSFEVFIRQFQEENWSLAKRNFSGTVVFSVASILVFNVVVFRVAIRTLTGTATIGDLAIFGGAAVRLRLTIERAIKNQTTALEQILYLDDLRIFLNSPDEKTREESVPHGGRVEFRNVFFTYPGGSEPVLSDFSLTVEEGETLAIVGPNGAGKTTIVKLLTGLYEADGGEILVGGAPVGDISKNDLRKSLSVVMQHFGMYEATAEENLAYGDWERLRGRSDLVRAVAERVGVREMIEGFPQGFDTGLGRSFGKHEISGGQWQKLALARGFARETPILILDEPTASLDARSELELFGQFTTLARGRTTILISHRFSTISMADRIAVVADGRVIEDGTHAELMARKGEYADLYTLHTKWMNEGRIIE